ncbi:RagB/SusD family nutrient uptake outer membrane protein [Draconibacterium halophilum]|uniref:RagB/SusD family nutrient uptake outer membrane protein n=1 Tax=Draconibacterium halophilum TaxID=2706887 RepID=A0A6C0REI2_9BACT|nr:RagB/SusD family nutrient uptake outer membrane protein [Draconibacterium halophilum]QIA08346.1 RagB/SusD family nutrient uptake outer membrane protein [Draconibacterium halophilum]
MKIKYLWLILMTTFFIGCDLEQIPQDTTSKDAVFGSETGLELYSYSFYDFLPSANNIHTADAMSDYAARRGSPAFIMPGAYSSTSDDDGSASGNDIVALGGDRDWGWDHLRNFNFFIENCTDERVPESVRNHYLGLARFFRAFFYFEKVKRYGDVPWIDKALDVEDPDLYKGRDPRELVMENVLADLDFATQNIDLESDGSRSLVTKWVAYALKARVCLFEGTFRKYHTNLGLQGTANDWLNEAASAAKAIMDQSGYKLYTDDGPDKSYRKIFTNSAPVSDEIMLAAVMSTAFGKTHAANWYYTSTTTGVRFNLIRTFVNTYLKLDGTPFTDTPGYETMQFHEEVVDRDLRLKQTIRLGDYERLNNNVPFKSAPNMLYSYTGYQPIKWCLDDINVDTRDLNDNSVSMFRYGEVLLNYAEAKAELGALTDADWEATIGALRARAGITGGLTTKPTVADPYLQEKYFPGISDPVILEVRRERGIELFQEGLRFYDVVRWHRGELMEMEWNGIYVPAIDTPLDLNQDGSPDVLYYIEAPTTAPSYPAIPVSELYGGKPNDYRLTNGTYGEITWLNTIERKWEEKNYFYPIPESAILTNPNLEQNPGW